MAEANGIEIHDLTTLFSGDGRDFLLRNNGDQVKIGELSGKKVGIYFSGHWCPPCRRFTPKLAEAYSEFSPKGFEVVFVSSDRDEDSFKGYFSEMPWLAVPFSDSAARQRLKSLFKVNGIPHLVILDGSTGEVLTDKGAAVVREYGTEAYPFTPERLAELKEEEAATKRNQTLHSILASPSRDFVVDKTGTKVPIAELEGKTVCLYFSVSSYPPCLEFTGTLTKLYEELKAKGEAFQVVLISLDDDEAAFEEDLGRMPWLSLPFKDKSCERLIRYFDLRALPTLVVLGPDGKTRSPNAVELVEEHGAAAYPFSPEKLAELVELERARQEAQTLESLLVSGGLDYVIAKDGAKIPVSELVGKNILLYFSAHWCPPCRGFTPRLIQVFHEIKALDSAFEVVFCSGDHDQGSFDEYFAEMPWLALPFGDEREKSLSRKFKITGIPSLVAIGPSGRTVTMEAREMVAAHGAAAYPFSEDRIKQLEQEMAKGWPQKVKHELHEHELVLTRRRSYVCDGCNGHGQGWSFYCSKCDFDLHPKFALEEKGEAAEDKPTPTEEGASKEGEIQREVEMAEANGVETHDLTTLFSGDGRDFLVRNNGDQVKIGELSGKKVGIYFSGHWCPPCRQFTPKLAEAYSELSPKGFEVVFVSSDGNDDSFKDYFSEMPWLAVPFADSAARQRLKSLFKVNGIPHLVILDGSTGEVLTDKGAAVVREYGTEAYPFTPERLAELKEEEEAAKRNQTVHSILASPSRDFVVDNSGTKVPIAKLEGKTVCLYFSVSSYPPCLEFTGTLTKLYEELMAKGEAFQVVLISLDDDEAAFEEDFGRMPWLSLPFKDKSCERLIRYFELRALPTLVVLGPDGKTRSANAVELVEEHGAAAYPFSPEKLAELDRARQEAQTLESLLVSGDLDYVIAKDGAQIPVSELVGKNILLYFSAHWCPPCRGFTPRLIQVYHEIKALDTAFEVVFCSGDHDQGSFDEYFAEMPWLALPFGDEREKSLSRKFKITGIPSLVAIGPSGRTVTTEAREMVAAHGATAYPFSEDRIKQLEQEMEEMAKGWPQKVKHELHEHELVLTRRRSYGCDGCNEHGQGWSFYCSKCDFDLHPKCALKEEKKEAAEDKPAVEGASKEGYVCVGEVCRKA